MRSLSLQESDEEGVSINPIDIYLLRPGMHRLDKVFQITVCSEQLDRLSSSPPAEL